MRSSRCSAVGNRTLEAVGCHCPVMTCPLAVGPLGELFPSLEANLELEPTDDDYDIDYTLEPRAKKILAGLGA